METIKIQTHVGSDGVLTLQLPSEMAGQELEVLVTVHPKEKKHVWPPGYFDRTAGSLADDPIERPPQGHYETRDALE